MTGILKSNIKDLSVILMINGVKTCTQFGLGPEKIRIFKKCYYIYKSCIRSNTCIQDKTSTKSGAFCVAFILSVINKMKYNKT